VLCGFALSSLLRNPLAGSIWYDTKQQRQPSLEQAKKTGFLKSKSLTKRQKKQQNQLYVLCTIANTPVRKQNTILESTNGPREKKNPNISQHQRLMTLKVVR